MKAWSRGGLRGGGLTFGQGENVCRRPDFSTIAG